MKATAKQRETFHHASNAILGEIFGKTRDDVHTLRDAWWIFQHALLQWSNGDSNPNIKQRVLPRVERPIGHGTHRDWLFHGLNDSHLQTLFKAEYPNLR